MSDQPVSDLEKAAQEQGAGSFLGDFWYFLRTNKKWWLLPILFILVLLGGLLAISSSGVAPFLYPFF